jgi:hypothetical protein
MTKRQTAIATALLHAFDYADARRGDFTHEPALPVDTKFASILSSLEKTLSEVGIKKSVQTGAQFHQHTGSQAQLRDELEEELSDAAHTANSIANAPGGDPSLLAHFRVPDNHSDPVLATTARTIIAAIRQFGLNPAFASHGWSTDAAAELETLLLSFEKTEGDQGGTLGDQVGATAAIPGLLREGRDAVHALTSIFRRIYKARKDILAAWHSAAHVEKTGSSTPAAKATPPTPPAS